MQYQCSICGYIYDDAKEKVPFSELPASWKCPLCGAPKSAFRPVEAAKKPAPKPATGKSDPEPDEDLQKLSAGQLSALFSNLARGCEKQYKPEESVLFMELADSFGAPAAENASPEALAALLQADVSANYPMAKAVAEEQGDRGAQRICVWGDKVTRMLSVLAERYRSEGEAMLANTEVWVCSVCGFVYIGEKAPEQCPVCKVPAWKFEKIEGRN